MTHYYNVISADYAAVGQLRGYLENLVCNEVVAIDDGVDNADLDRGILENRLNFSIGFGRRWFLAWLIKCNYH